MKRFLLIVFILFVSSNAFGAATALPTSETPFKIWNQGIEETYIYDLTTSVASGDGDVVFQIPSRNSAGRIKKVYIKTASDNLDGWISAADGETKDSPYTFINFNADEGYSPYIPPTSEPYYNRDTPVDAYLYLTLDNLSSTATGTAGILIIIYVRY